MTDAELLEMTKANASYMYRRRTENNENTAYWTEANQWFDMPRMLRHAMNNRLFSQKMRAES